MTAIASTIRSCTEADIPWMLEVAKAHYGGRFDERAAVAWGVARMQNPDMAFLRGDRAFIIGYTDRRFQRPENLQAFMSHLYAQPNAGWEVVSLIGALRDWAKRQGATKLWFGDSTGHDLKAVAARIGGRLAGHTYIVDLDGDPTSLG